MDFLIESKFSKADHLLGFLIPQPDFNGLELRPEF